MTRHDWIVLGGIVTAAAFVIAGVIFQSGRLDSHVSDVDQRVERVEEKVDDGLMRLSRIEGYLGTDSPAHTRIVPLNE